MKVTLTVTIEKIDNGYILRQEATDIARYVQYDFALARELETMAIGAIRVQLQALEADAAPMQQDAA